jgi:hypothetical protein
MSIRQGILCPLCGAEYNYIKRDCALCGVPFFIRKPERRLTRKYCSESCRLKAYRKRKQLAKELGEL